MPITFLFITGSFIKRDKLMSWLFYCPERIKSVVAGGMYVLHITCNTFIKSVCMCVIVLQPLTRIIISYRVTSKKIYHLLSASAIVMNFVNLNMYKLYFKLVVL